MEASPYGAGLDPTPYIALAYGLGAAGIFGYAGWVLKERLKLRQLLAAVKPERARRSRP